MIYFKTLKVSIFRNNNQIISFYKRNSQYNSIYELRNEQQFNVIANTSDNIAVKHPIAIIVIL
jgi:hypothetical protein